MDQSAGMLSEDVKDKGYALLCVSYPQGDCTIQTIDEVCAPRGPCLRSQSMRWAARCNRRANALNGIVNADGSAHCQPCIFCLVSLSIFFTAAWRPLSPASPTHFGSQDSCWLCAG